MTEQVSFEEVYAQHAAGADSLQAEDSWGVVVEQHPTPFSRATVAGVSQVGNGPGQVFHRALNRGDVVQEWSLPCSMRYIRREMAALEALGVWTQQHFITSWDLLDGAWTFVRIKQPAGRRERILCLFEPEYTHDKDVKRLGAYLRRMIERSRFFTRLRILGLR